MEIMIDAESLVKRFVRLYANADNLSSDIREIELFSLWLEAVKLYDPEQATEERIRRTYRRQIQDDGR
jgi:hypothetical protein